MSGQNSNSFTEKRNDAHSEKEVDISIVIVNYNVKEFVSNLLGSIDKALNSLNLEIFVVDNASSDGSLNYLKKRFPKVQYIANKKNAGFGKANNQAIYKASGKYTLLINPDTLIRNDTLKTMLQHMENHPETGAAGCKILNPDGTFAPESRRSVPTPMSALWKILGLAKLFPNSKRFSAYYLGGKDENNESSVPVLSGAFMFVRTSILKENGGFDERFFMYGEDIDLCYRITQEGWQIDYVPATSIIHYKGESTKKENFDYVLTFNKAMYQFFTKHYSFGYTLLFRLFVLSGIILKGFISYVTSVLKRLTQPVFELTLMNVLVILLFMWRFDIALLDMPARYNVQFFAINAILSSFFVGSALYHDLYGKNRLSVPAIIKCTAIAFAGVVLVTFFLRDLAFSRLVLLLSAVSSTMFLVILRLIMINRSGRIPNVPGSFLERKLLLVGLSEKTPELIRKLRSKADWKYSIVGIVSQNESDMVDEIENVSVVGHISDIQKLVSFHKIDEILFSLPAVDYDHILRSIAEIRNPSVYPRIIADSMDYMVGKTHVEYLDDLPVMDIDLPFYSIWNRTLKRLLDISLSFMLICIMIPVIAGPLLLRYPKRKKIQLIYSDQSESQMWVIFPYHQNRWINRFLLLWSVFLGRISMVGGPIYSGKKPHFANLKPGMTGPRQLSEPRLYHEEERERHELYYLQNYSIWMDLDILLKTILMRQKTLRSLDDNG